jgi:hypothetical protein
VPRHRDSHNKGHLADLSERPQRPWSPTLRSARTTTHRIEFTPGLRVVVRTTMFKGKLQEFAVVLQALEDGEWVEIARGDCAHGQDVHLDFLDRSREVRRKQPVCAITCEDDVLTGYQAVYGTLQANAENYVREWRRRD